MNKLFNHIGLIGRQHSDAIQDTLKKLILFLEKNNKTIYIESETANHLDSTPHPIIPRKELSKHCECLIVVGGDGSMLNAARCASTQDLPVIGINKGRLGFLTDIHPNELETKIKDVLDGQYQLEKRFLINTTVLGQNNNLLGQGDSLNDVALLPGDTAHLIEFDIFVDSLFVCTQRADGLIISTPTGSTAYALSGGGPILHPKLDALVLVPMFPHTLSSRPIVIDGNSKIEIKIKETNRSTPRLSCDGHAFITTEPGSTVTVKKQPKPLTLIHPMDYQYYETLRTKLNWETK